MSRKIIEVTLTSYWPRDVHTDAERRMEGEDKDRSGKRTLISLQQHLADPVKFPWCDMAGDWTLWPYGQLILLLDLHKDAKFRITDTGKNFFGKNKKYRNPGCEPLDICVETRANNIGPLRAIATIVEGDDLTHLHR